MDDNLITGVIDTIDCANTHRLRLEELLTALTESQNQVKGSAQASEKKLQDYFGELKTQLISSLDTRLETLLKQVKDIETTALTPLNQCEVLIKQNVSTASQVLTQGKELLSNDHAGNEAAMREYKTKANELGLSTLPEVPPLSEVACIYIETPDVLRQQLLTDVSDYGRVIPRAPVQIVAITERPGSLVVKWAEVEDDESQELSEFALQYTCGSEMTSDVTLNDVSVGTATSFTLRHLKAMTMYSFRVKGRAEQAEIWSPWSVPQSAMTTIPHYAWNSTVPNFAVSNEYKIGEKTKKSSGEESCLYSAGSTYTCDNSIIFKVLEVGKLETTDGGVSQEEGIALTVSNTAGSLLTDGSVFISADGSVFLDGQEKLTKLPAFKRGSILTFDTEVLSSGKVRVNIEVDEKIVTFDWSVEKPPNSKPMGLFAAMSGSSDNDINLYYVMKFINEGWKVGVE